MRLWTVYGIASLICGGLATNYCWFNPYYDYCIGFGFNFINIGLVWLYLWYRNKQYGIYKKMDSLVLSEDRIYTFTDIENMFQDNELLPYMEEKIDTAVSSDI